MKDKKEKILPEGTLVPNHLAIICDGNRRWARARGKPAFEGHRRGFDITPSLSRACRDFGIHTLTFWVFSTENWDRPKEEIAFLMKKLEEFVGVHLKEAKKSGVRIIHLGRKDRIPSSLAKKIIRAEEETKENKKFVLNIALDYGGRDEILRAIGKMTGEKLTKENLNEEIFQKYLDTGSQPFPYPDLIIRPSGEQRTSGLLIWQGAYSETYWLPDHFPELNPEILKEALIDFSKRRRRFGGNDNVPRVKFSPEKLAKLESAYLQEGNWENQKKQEEKIGNWLKELYNLDFQNSSSAVQFYSEGLILAGKEDWTKAEGKMKVFYQIIKEATGYVFSPEVVAKLEVDLKKIEKKTKESLDKAELEKALRDYYGEIYRLSDLQSRRMAYYKTLAITAFNSAGNNSAIAEKYLIRAYEMLREVAS